MHIPVATYSCTHVCTCVEQSHMCAAIFCKCAEQSFASVRNTLISRHVWSNHTCAEQSFASVRNNLLLVLQNNLLQVCGTIVSHDSRFLHVPVSTSKVTILAEQSCRTGWNYRAAGGRVQLPRAVQLPFCRHGMSVFMDAFIYNIQVCIYICVDTCVYMKKYLLFQLLRAVQMPFCRRSMPVFMDACVCNLDVCIYTYVYYII